MECVAFSCLLLRFGEDLGLIFEKMWYNGNYWRLIVMQLVRWGWRVLFAVVSGLIFPGSSMVEQEAVNFEVAGSSPAPGARFPFLEYKRSSRCLSTERNRLFCWSILGSRK